MGKLEPIVIGLLSFIVQGYHTDILITVFILFAFVTLLRPQWWKRKLQSIYLPPTQASTPRLTQLMAKLGIEGKKVKLF